MSRKALNPAGATVRAPAGAATDQAFIAHYQATPAAATNTAVASALALADAAQPTVTAGITSPAVARCLRVAGTASGMAGDVVVTGTNLAGDTITETFALNGTTGVVGSKAFASVTSVALPAKTNASGDTVNIGTTDKLGLPAKLAHNTVFLTFYNNTLEGTAPTVTVSAAALESNTIDLNSALAGAVVDAYLLI